MLLGKSSQLKVTVTSKVHCALTSRKCIPHLSRDFLFLVKNSAGMGDKLKRWLSRSSERESDAGVHVENQANLNGDLVRKHSPCIPMFMRCISIFWDFHIAYLVLQWDLLRKSTFACYRFAKPQHQYDVDYPEYLWEKGKKNNARLHVRAMQP